MIVLGFMPTATTDFLLLTQGRKGRHLGILLEEGMFDDSGKRGCRQ